MKCAALDFAHSHLLRRNLVLPGQSFPVENENIEVLNANIRPRRLHCAYDLVLNLARAPRESFLHFVEKVVGFFRGMVKRREWINGHVVEVVASFFNRRSCGLIGCFGGEGGQGLGRGGVRVLKVG